MLVSFLSEKGVKISEDNPCAHRDYLIERARQPLLFSLSTDFQNNAFAKIFLAN